MGRALFLLVRKNFVFTCALAMFLVVPHSQSDSLPSAKPSSKLVTGAKKLIADFSKPKLAKHSLAHDCLTALKLNDIIDAPINGLKKSTHIDPAEINPSAVADPIIEPNELANQHRMTEWFATFAKRMHTLRSKMATAEREGGPAPKMSISDFLSMIDDGFGHQGQFARALADFNIHNIRFSSGKKFKVSVETVGKESEIILDVPDVSFDNPVETALWTKDFALALQHAARKQMARRLDALKPNESEDLWEKGKLPTTEPLRETLKRLSHETTAVIAELDTYITKMTPGLTPEQHADLLGLPKTTYVLSDGFYRGKSYLFEISTFASGPIVEIGRHYLKLGNPVEHFGPSRLWLESKDGIEIELRKLDLRMNNYFARRKRLRARGYWLTYAALMAAGTVTYHLYFGGGGGGQAVAQLQAEGDKTEQLNEIIAKANKRLGKDALEATISEAEAEHNKIMSFLEKGTMTDAVRRKYEVNAVRLTQALEKLYIRLSALSINNPYDQPIDEKPAATLKDESDD